MRLRRLKRFRHGFGIRAARLEVRPRFAWYAYMAAGAFAMLLLGGLVFLVWSGFRTGKDQNPDVHSLQQRLAVLEAQLVQGGGAFTSLEALTQANATLADELRQLEGEQAILRDDLAYFLPMVPVGAEEGAVRLDRLVIQPDVRHPGHYRFSVWVGYASGRRPEDFSGVLKFVLTVIRQGKTVQIDWPPAGAEPINVKTRQWVHGEGRLELEPGDQLTKVVLNLQQGKKLRASTNLVF